MDSEAGICCIGTTDNSGVADVLRDMWHRFALAVKLARMQVKGCKAQSKGNLWLFMKLSLSALAFAITAAWKLGHVRPSDKNHYRNPNKIR